MNLWESLGGEKVMRKVVDRLVDRALTDPDVDYTRDGRYSMNAQMLTRTKEAALAFLSSAIGGPIPYKGRSLKAIHSGMQIKNSEFDAFAVHFKAALAENGVADPLVDTVMQAVEAVRPTIVSA